MNTSDSRPASEKMVTNEGNDALDTYALQELDLFP